MTAPLLDRKLGAGTVLFGVDNGKYPDANAVLVEGTEERVLLDTTPGVDLRGRAAIGTVDRILLTHAHEDHMAANYLFPDAAVHVHSADAPALHSLDAMLDMYGVEPQRRERLAALLLEKYNFVPRPDAIAFEDGDRFELGGGVAVEVIHAPGHTGGHCVFRVEPDDLLFLADVDLSSFGPYYGDRASSLVDFERTLEKLRPIEARWYLSGHHIGLLDSREAFLERLDRYSAKIVERETRLLEYLAEPRTMDEIVAHRFIYRPHDDLPGADDIERTSMGLHIERLLAERKILETVPGHWKTA